MPEDVEALTAVTAEGARREQQGVPLPNTPSQQASQASVGVANLPPELQGLLAINQAALGNAGDSSDDFDLLLDRRITGPQTSNTRETFMSNPRVSRPVQAPR